MKAQADRIAISLREAARLTGYTPEHLRNEIYKGKLTRASRRSDGVKSDGVAKRGQKIRVWKDEVQEKYLKVS